MSDSGLPAVEAPQAKPGAGRCNASDLVCIGGIIVVTIAGLCAVTFWKVPVDTALAICSPPIAGFFAFLKGT